MKSLKDLAAVSQALSIIQKSKLVSDNNGTLGQEVQCYYWSFETVKNADRSKLEKERVKYYFDRNIDKLKETEEKLKSLPADEIMMVFRLLNPITRLQGTKPIKVDNKIVYPVASNIQEIYIRQMTIEGDYTSFEESGEMAQDAMGKESPVITLKLNECILDVQEAGVNYDGSIWRKARVFATSISHNAMSIAGKVSSSIQKERSKLIGTTGEI